MKAYDDVLRFILENGERRINRTGIDTLSVFCKSCVYEIGEYFPLLTKRKLFPKSVFAELLWMLSGSSDNNELIELGCNFWTPWVDIKNKDNYDFYERTKLPVGFLGPVYGWQLRHFGGDYWKYVKDRNYVGGFDQIDWLVREIKSNPHSRRLYVSMWNPNDINLSRLPPCHVNFHIDIDQKKRMSLVMNQRSCDYPVGAPANIQFYSALCYMLAQQTGYTPYRFIHNTEDTHIYVNQISQIEEYLSRPEVESPRLILEPARDIFSYKVEDFRFVDYNPLDSIKMPVSV